VQEKPGSGGHEQRYDRRDDACGAGSGELNGVSLGKIVDAWLKKRDQHEPLHVATPVVGPGQEEPRWCEDKSRHCHAQPVDGHRAEVVERGLHRRKAGAPEDDCAEQTQKRESAVGRVLGSHGGLLVVDMSVDVTLEV